MLKRERKNDKEKKNTTSSQERKIILQKKWLWTTGSEKEMRIKRVSTSYKRFRDQ